MISQSQDFGGAIASPMGDATSPVGDAIVYYRRCLTRVEIVNHSNDCWWKRLTGTTVIVIIVSLMKSKAFQNFILSKYEKGESLSKISRHLNGALCLRTVKGRCKMIRETGSIELSTSSGRSPIIRTKESTKKEKDRLNRKTKATSRKLAAQPNISRTSVRRILKNELLL